MSIAHEVDDDLFRQSGAAAILPMAQQIIRDELNKSGSAALDPSAAGALTFAEVARGDADDGRAKGHARPLRCANWQ